MIRPLAKSDLAYLIEIENLTQMVPWTKDVFERCLELGYLGWVTEKEGKMVGFIIISFQGPEGHILDICIHPDYQHQGLGRELLQYVLDFAKNKYITISYLEVRRSNQAAIALYQQLGFVQIGERKNYYATKTGREDALIFAKDLAVQ